MDDLRSDTILVEIDQELMSMIPGYLAGRRQECGEIERLLASGTLDEILSIGHRMRGSGGSFGFDEISEIGESLESACRAADAAGIRSAVGRLESFLARVEVAFV